MAAAAADGEQLTIRKPNHYQGTTTRDLRTEEVGRYNDLDRGEPMTVWSAQSGDDIPKMCSIPQLEPPTVFPLSLRIEEAKDGWVEVSAVDKILRWAEAVGYSLSEVNVVVGRALIKKLCRTPYNRKDGWKMKLYRFKDTVCLDTDEEHHNYGPDKFADWGKVFEDVMRTGGKRTPGYACEDVDIRMPRLVKLGALKILTNSRIAGQMPGHNQDVMKNYVEMKTAAVIESDQQSSKFARYKLRDFWAHCAPVGIETVYIGHRTRNGDLEDVRKWTMRDIERAGSQWWRPEVMLSFLEELLSWLLDNTTEGMTYSVTYDGADFTSPVCLVPEEQSELVRIVRASFPDE